MNTELQSLYPSEFMPLECNAEGILSFQSPPHDTLLRIKYCIARISRMDRIIILKVPKESKWVLPGSAPCNEAGGSKEDQ